ncbi:ATP-binding protein [Muriicola sp. Z0-33]|uniref:ATP-binding protein n=1 Tax=Muriicola sp. Z0-33 TaxID=2816957 RepID=UPI0022376C67|nr:ATP-binding protein [Muriicola sp. Z0-33]MCW5516984.1 tetratricopeptide repeat protein [Muriicola sp. Z0-33]
MERKISILIWSIFVCNFALGQTAKIDSLKNASGLAVSDSSKIKILKDISWEYLNNRYNGDLAKVYIDSVFDLSIKAEIPWGTALANYQSAVLERQQGNYDRALDFINANLAFWETRDNQNALANGLYQKAVILDHLGSYEKSLDIYFSILKIYEEQQDNFSIATTLNALGEIFKKTGKMEKAMESYTRALDIYTGLENKLEMANCNFNIGDTYLQQQELDKALFYFNKALALDEAVNSQWGIAYDVEAIAKVYGLKGNYADAISYNQRALKLREALQQKKELSMSHTQLGKNYIALGNYPKAQEHLTEAIRITEEIGAKPELQTNYDAIATLHEQTGNLQQALNFKNKSTILKDSLYNIAKSRQIEELQVRFDTEKKQSAIATLEKDAEIKDLRLKRQTTIRNILIGLSLVLVLLAYALFNRYKYRQRIKLEDEEKRRMIEVEKEKTEIERNRVEELKKIDKLKDEFLANTSHELRTPLNGIIGLSESLKDGAAGKLNARTIENLDMITNSGKRLAHLVNDILDFSKLKNSDLELSLRPVDLQAITRVVLKLSAPLIDDKELQLESEIGPKIPMVEADENRLQQILHNLLGNAIKFTNSGTVKISAEYKKDRVYIAISDTGIGIPEERMEAIFESFEQGNGSTAREFGGTGLGLSVTKQLVELHGGNIEVSSEVGQGSVFTFSLPASKVAKSATSDPTDHYSSITQKLEEHNAVDQQSTTIKEQELSTAKILVVDDEPVNRRVLENHLTLAGYTVVEASSGNEALQKIAQEHDFNLVLLDVMMPVMSGYEVCEKIRKDNLPSELPVVLLTAKNRVSDLVIGFNVGANDYLTKPFSKNELLSRMKTHLNLSGIHKATSKFVPTEFIKSVGRESITEISLGDHVQKDVTVLFSDIRHYTHLAENMTPQQTFKFVNSYVGKMGPLIQANMGFVNQYLGDGIMALFPHKAEHALQAAIDMQKAIAQYNIKRKSEGKEEISVGIGLHTGSLVMGIIGDIHRNDTAIIADTVNTASRMEGVTKHYGANIIISEDSLKTIKNKTVFGLRFLGRVKAIGKDNAVGIYECFDGDSVEMVKLKKKTLPEFKKGLEFFFAHEFPRASASFDKVLGKNPNDLVAKYFVTKSAEYTIAGSPKDWEVINTMKEK